LGGFKRLRCRLGPKLLILSDPSGSEAVKKAMIPGLADEGARRFRLPHVPARYWLGENKSEITLTLLSQAWFRHGSPKPASIDFSREKWL